MPRSSLSDHKQTSTAEWNNSIGEALALIATFDAWQELDDQQLLRLLKSSLPIGKQHNLSGGFHDLAGRFERLAFVVAADEGKRLLKRARRQASNFRTKLVYTKKLISSRELCDALDISRQALSKAVGSHRIFTIELGGENYYPAFFADPTYNRRQLERISKTLADLHGSVKWQFFTTPKLTLAGRTPLEALAARELESVLNAAAGFASL